jgi:hypothetical protein
MLDAHNAVRAAAMPAPSPALPPLTWSDAAAQHATAWANGCQWMHSGDSRYGESIFGSSNATSPQGVVTSWESEKANYDYATNSCSSSACGHYTQLVWRDTAAVGCGVATCTTGSPLPGHSSWQFWVCNYDPPGNIVGQQPY